MARTGYPVGFDATHSGEPPAGMVPLFPSGGQREFAPVLAGVHSAFGVGGVSSSRRMPIRITPRAMGQP